MTTIFDNSNFTLSCNVDPLDALCGDDRPKHYWLQFSTKLATAKEPSEERHAFAALLNRDELLALRQTLTDALEPV